MIGTEAVPGQKHVHLKLEWPRIGGGLGLGIGLLSSTGYLPPVERRTLASGLPIPRHLRCA
jgi:hypothetical protein